MRVLGFILLGCLVITGLQTLITALALVSVALFTFGLVFSATATAMSCLLSAEIAPSLNTALSNSQNAFIASGAPASSIFRFFSLSMSCMSRPS